jgi:hypothetical protein
VPTIRGFVQSIEVGRAGLVRALLVHADGSSGTYVIEDLDADPERFNERLSKVGLLRDAMNRAEPVEIEHQRGEGGDSIERVVRITRDALAPVSKVEQAAGLVVDLLLHAENGLAGQGEKHDHARVHLLATDLASRTMRLNLQAPERLVAVEQLEMLRDAQARGRIVRLLVDTAQPESPWIVAVAVDNTGEAFGGDRAVEVDGFVESLSLLRVPFPGGSSLSSNFAHVRFTTAPRFVGAGNIVSRSPFTPATLEILVPERSLAYDLFEAGLRDNLRMRTSVVLLSGRAADDQETNAAPRMMEHRESAEVTGAAGAGELVNRISSLAANLAGEAGEEARYGIALGAALLAPLASASRPVWIDISRTSLDHGSEVRGCTPGTPSSDLQPQTLRDLRIPYPAVWRGFACFNEGIYRFQFQLRSPFVVRVDGEELCLYDSDAEGVRFAHACLGGDHHVEVAIEEWRCEDEFIMDVYRLR